MKIVISFLYLITVLPAMSQIKSNETGEHKNIHQPRYCLFFDNHTMPAIPDVGKNFDVEAFTDRIKDCGVDYLIFSIRCNQGMAYYDTKMGIKHPSLEYDLLGRLAKSCQQKEIALLAYFHAGLSSAEGLQHRDWTTLSFDGWEYREPRFTPYVRTMCYNSPYRDHLIGMIEEVAGNYPVSGIFIDGLQDFGCICPICVKEMKERGVDYSNREEVGKFSHFSIHRLAEDIAGALEVINPDFLLYFKGVPFEQQPGLSNHMVSVHLPSTLGEGGYEILPVYASYLRTLSDLPVMNMTARFYDWGDFGGLRPEAALKSELLYGLANGMRPNVGGHFHPRGDLNNAVFDRIEKIYKELQTMEPWFEDAKNITEIAVVSTLPVLNENNSGQLKAAVRMLGELKQQFDVVTTFSDWSKYKVLVIPDDVTFDAEVTRRVKEHLAAGKAVISSGSSGL
ncbi:alpha-amylase family protein, partial [Mariniphaga sediminis]